jgi:hypothetical protein
MASKAEKGRKDWTDEDYAAARRAAQELIRGRNKWSQAPKTED